MGRQGGNLTGCGPDFGHKKRPRQEPAYRAWVLSPDGYAVLPMRPITTKTTVAIFMTLNLDGKSTVVNACAEDRSRHGIKIGRGAVQHDLTFKNEAAFQENSAGRRIGIPNQADNSVGVKLGECERQGLTDQFSRIAAPPAFRVEMI
jgi:hypothetical protein